MAESKFEWATRNEVGMDSDRVFPGVFRFDPVQTIFSIVCVAIADFSI